MRSPRDLRLTLAGQQVPVLVEPEALSHSTAHTTCEGLLRLAASVANTLRGVSRDSRPRDIKAGGRGQRKAKRAPLDFQRSSLLIFFDNHARRFRHCCPYSSCWCPAGCRRLRLWSDG